MGLQDNLLPEDDNGIPTSGMYNEDTELVEPLKSNANGELKVDTKDYGSKIALGEVDGYSVIYKFGRSENIGTTESILRDGGTGRGSGNGYEFQETATLLDIVSDSANDTNNGTGAWNVVISGLDADYNLQTEIVTLSGVATVTTTKTFISVYSAKVQLSGDGTFLPNAGNISIYVTATITLQAKILVGQGQTQMCIFIVPAGYSALISNMTYSSGEGKKITMRLRVQEDRCAFVVKAIREVFEQNVAVPLNPPLSFKEKSKICVTGEAEAGVGTPKGAASFGIILVKNT